MKSSSVHVINRWVALSVLTIVGAFASSASALSITSPPTATSTPTSITVNWSTDASATTQVIYGTSLPYSASSTLDASFLTTHVVNLVGLLPNTVYHFMAQSVDASSTVATSSDAAFATLPLASTSTPTTSAPSISALVAAPLATSAIITWTTDQPASSQIAYGISPVYTASSTLDSTLVLSHSVALSGLTPNTWYHFSATSMNASSTSTSSPDMAFFTPAAPTTTPTTTAPVISSILANPTDTTATITWNTDQNANSQVVYGLTSAYGSSSTLNASFVTGHSDLVGSLSPSTLYHFAVKSANASGTPSMSADMTFTTQSSTTTGGTLQDQINQLLARITALEGQLALILQQLGTPGSGGNHGGGNGNHPMIEQDGRTIHAGDVIDFGGRGFGHEENVAITLAGQTVATPHADGGGNFSTGSFRAPTTPGTYTYTFTGKNDGDTANATITVTQ